MNSCAVCPSYIVHTFPFSAFLVQHLLGGGGLDTAAESVRSQVSLMDSFTSGPRSMYVDWRPPSLSGLWRSTCLMQLCYSATFATHSPVQQRCECDSTVANAYGAECVTMRHCVAYCATVGNAITDATAAGCDLLPPHYSLRRCVDFVNEPTEWS